jgi:hypothetical protein
MIRNSDYFEQTDKYLTRELSATELGEFELQLEFDSDLADELNLHLDVEQAMGEQEIISLRSNLNQIAQNASDQEITENISVFDSFSFGLSEEFTSHKNLNRRVSLDDMADFGHSFPKIHLYQHQVAGKENTHQFYKEQFEADSLSGEDSLNNPYEEELFGDIQSALGEHDVLDIRANLKQIAQSMPAHQYSAEEIDDYIYQRMDADLHTQFEGELCLNSSLADDVRLSRELDLSGAENDIIALRASLQEIQKTEFHSTSRIEDIEGYLNGELSDEHLASFELELESNRGLISEVDLIRNIDRALQESDVMQLRSKLGTIARESASEKQTERSLSLSGRYINRRVILSSVAASLILLLGITGLLSRQASQKDLYQKYYTAYQTTGINRSESLSADQTLTMAMQKYNNQEYESALGLLQEVISRDQNNMVGHFYRGVSLQQTGKYQNAIKEYETVIVDKDNLFVEQAEWYAGLCYLQTNENKKAYKQFKKIAKSQGFYGQRAQAILGKMENSIE